MRNKKRIIRKSVKPSLYSTLLLRPETTIGLVVLAILGLAMLFSGIAALRTRNSSKPLSVQPIVHNLSSTLPTTATAAAIATATAQVQPLTPTATPTAQVQRVVVKKDQTFWELSKRYCGSHKQAESLAKNNGYNGFSKLREGATISIKCW